MTHYDGDCPVCGQFLRPLRNFEDGKHLLNCPNKENLEDKTWTAKAWFTFPVEGRFKGEATDTAIEYLKDLLGINQSFEVEVEEDPAAFKEDYNNDE